MTEDQEIIDLAENIIKAAINNINKHNLGMDKLQEQVEIHYLLHYIRISNSNIKRQYAARKLLVLMDELKRQLPDIHFSNISDIVGSYFMISNK
jgi:hypothetical protein